MNKTAQRKQIKEIAKNLKWNHKVELLIVHQRGGDVCPYPIAKAPLITGNEYDCYLVGYRREGFGDNAHFWTEDSITLKLTENGIEHGSD